MTTRRGVRWRYYVYKAATSMGPYLPIYVIFLLDKGYGLEFIALMQAVFSVVLLAAELPAGYLGDRLGRRWTLVGANLFRVAGVAGYVVAASPGQFLFLKVLTGVSWALRSGAQDAWLYELLAAHDDPDAFVHVSSRGRTALMATSAVGAIVGGVLYQLNPAFPFLLTAALGALTLPVLLTFPAAEGAEEAADEVPTETDPAADALTVRQAVRTLRTELGRPSIRWVVAYSVLLFLMFDLSRTFEQPAMDAVGVSVAGMGVLYAGFKLASAAAASTTGWLTDRLGLRRTLALGVPVLGAAYATVLVVPVAVVPVLFLYRGARSVLKPVRNQYLNDRLEDAGRATVLSGVSMALSLVGAVARLVGGEIAAAIGPVAFVAAAGVGLSVAAGVLWLAVSPVRPVEGGTDRPAVADG
jgi:MFS family permease